MIAFAQPDATLDKFGLWRSLASALAWGARGPGFKSRQPDHTVPILTAIALR